MSNPAQFNRNNINIDSETKRAVVSWLNIHWIQERLFRSTMNGASLQTLRHAERKDAAKGAGAGGRGGASITCREITGVNMQ